MPTCDPTSRFAVVNMDWANIRAVDLLQLFESFKPAGGCVKSVAVYLSDFGARRLAEVSAFSAFGSNSLNVLV